MPRASNNATELSGFSATYAVAEKERRRAASKQTLPMKQATATTAALEAPHGHQALSAYITARFDEFSRSQKDVAQYIVDHLDEAAFQTAEELARRANRAGAPMV